MKTTLPFAGFYNSVYEACIERLFEEVDNDEDFGVSKLALAIAKDYTKFFAHYFNLKLTFKSLLRPREYNFRTDEIVVDLQDVKDLYKRVNKETLKDFVRETCSDRSGFVSFYSPDVEDWGDLADWDGNQVGCLLEALLIDEGFTEPDSFDEFYCDRTCFESLLWR